MELTEEMCAKLCARALEMRKYSYVPYSNFRVGAALLSAGGQVYAGCNIENAAYTPSVCAERTAFFRAVSEGEREFTAIAIAGGATSESEMASAHFAGGVMESQRLDWRESVLPEYCAPCGVCRQVMAEFCRPDFQILLVRSRTDWRVMTLGQLLPESFGPGNLKEGAEQHGQHRWEKTV